MDDAPKLHVEMDNAPKIHGENIPVEGGEKGHIESLASNDEQDTSHMKDFTHQGEEERQAYTQEREEQSPFHKTLATNPYPQNVMELETPKSDVDDDGKLKRKGNVYTASAHIITAVIGSGVLSLAWSFAQLGWIAGPIIMLLFAWCTLYTSKMLADCYRSPHPVTGKRNYSYVDAVKTNLSYTSYVICGLVQYSNLIGTSVGYTITTATNARAIQKTNCDHTYGPNSDRCLSSTTIYILIYGIVEILLSQIPNFGDLWWLSYLAAIMSFTYSIILLFLGIEKTAKATKMPGHDFGSITGVPIGSLHALGQVSRATKVWNMFAALGDIAFAYSFSVILLEISDTLRSSPPENKQMKRASTYGIGSTTFFYMAVGVFGYLSFGNTVNGNILTSFESPYWLVDFANACVVIHLIGAYQVFAQPVFQFVENWVWNKYPKSSFLTKSYNIPLRFIGNLDVNLFRSIWRTIYVVVTTCIAMVLPFFNDVLGILGAFGFWPLTVYFPVAMFIHQFQIPRWSKKWIALQLLSLSTFIVSVVTLIGSIVGIYIDVKDGIKLFKKD